MSSQSGYEPVRAQDNQALSSSSSSASSAHSPSIPEPPPTLSSPPSSSSSSSSTPASFPTATSTPAEKRRPSDAASNTADFISIPLNSPAAAAQDSGDNTAGYFSVDPENESAESKRRTHQWAAVLLIVVLMIISAIGVAYEDYTLPLWGFLAVLPALCFMYYFYWRGDNRMHAFSLTTLICFLVGALLTIPAAVAEAIFLKLLAFIFFQSDIADLQTVAGFFFTLSLCFLLVAPIEECLKHMVAYFTERMKECFHPHGALVYGLTGALGFAVAENLMYLFITESLIVALLRMFLSVPLHAMTGLYFGIMTGKRKFFGESFPSWRIVLPAVGIHGTFDFTLLLIDEDLDASTGVKNFVCVICALSIVAVGYGYIYWLLKKQSGQTIIPISTVGLEDRSGTDTELPTL